MYIGDKGIEYVCSWIDMNGGFVIISIIFTIIFSFLFIFAGIDRLNKSNENDYDIHFGIACIIISIFIPMILIFTLIFKSDNIYIKASNISLEEMSTMFIIKEYKGDDIYEVDIDYSYSDYLESVKGD